MIEGWHNQDYVILFDDDRVDEISSRYRIKNFLKGYTIVGLRGWDDFIVRDKQQRLFTVPTIPLDEEYLEPLSGSIDRERLQADSRFQGKIKWYITPIIFGGDPGQSDNLIWVTLDQHIQLVAWWNDKYRAIK